MRTPSNVSAQGIEDEAKRAAAEKELFKPTGTPSGGGGMDKPPPPQEEIDKASGTPQYAKGGPVKGYAKGGDVRVQEDRARGGPVITTRSKFLKTPDVFRTDTERNEYGPKSGKGGELAETEGDTKSQKPVKPRT